ncbi:MAG: DUF1080 domain-containing protein [Saprospiraceae bacterium]|nr:DUF1080 domain-containing protein [Saprospiraceae bacterium]
MKHFLAILCPFVCLFLTSPSSLLGQSTGVGAKPPKGVKLYLDGTAKTLHKNWTYWKGPRLAQQDPVKWPVVLNPNGKGSAVSSNDPASAGGVYGAADLVTKQNFRDFRAHVEFLIQKPHGNSGVYLQNRYEIQVLDGDSTAHGMAAIINEKRAPYHLYKGLGQWNAYDIVFRAARFKDGKMVEKPLVTLHFNGVKIHRNQSIQRVWGGANSGIDGGNDQGRGITDQPGGLKLQAEGHDVLYRNIWIQEMDLSTANTDLIEPGLPALEATPYPAQLLRVPFTSREDGTKREFFLYLPKGFDGVVDKKYPVLMFLHGNGERGNGLDELDYTLIHGPLYEAWIQKRDLPFIIISPQLPMYGMNNDRNPYIKNRTRAIIPQRLKEGTPPRDWGDKTIGPLSGTYPSDSFPNGIKTLPDGWPRIEEDLVGMIEMAHERYQGDKNKTYLTGLSYGGFGTWHFASTHPQYFAAIAPVVGWGHPDFMKPISDAQIPVWVFSAGFDTPVPKKYFYAGLNTLKALGCPDLRFTIHEDAGHDAWKRIYGGQDLYDWLLSKTKK